MRSIFLLFVNYPTSELVTVAYNKDKFEAKKKKKQKQRTKTEVGVKTQHKAP